VDTDALLHRVERTAIVLCGAMVVLALVVARGAPGPAIAVIAGGILVGVSYWSIKSGVTGLTLAIGSGAAGASARAPRWRIALQLAGRYALLALLAYVMIARLSLHPLWLLAGASSVVASVTVEALRVFVKKP
jgi:hypothetical protein